jgi:hypothetical protein
MAPEPEKKTVAVTGILLDELKAMAPGQVYRLSGRDGRQYAILEWEDFEHVAEQAGMGTELGKLNKA